MSRASEPITVALLALPATTAATLYGFHDALASVRRDWGMLHGQPPVESPFRPLVVSPDGAPLSAANDAAVPWLLACHAQGALVAYCDHLQRAHPKTRHYDSAAPVAQMVALSQPERTFKRRFAQATGMAPLDYVHHVRLEEAKQMLERGSEAVAAIAMDIGYSDSSFFSRLFRRKVGMSPVQYRQRFGRLARELQGLAGPAG